MSGGVVSGMSMGGTVGPDDDGGDCGASAPVGVNAAVAESSGTTVDVSAEESSGIT